MLVAVESSSVVVVPMLAASDYLLQVVVGNSFSGVNVRLARGIGVAKVVLFMGFIT